MSENETVEETFSTSLVGKEDVVILDMGIQSSLTVGMTRGREHHREVTIGNLDLLGWMSGHWMDSYNEQYFSLDRLEF